MNPFAPVIRKLRECWFSYIEHGIEISCTEVLWLAMPKKLLIADDNPPVANYQKRSRGADRCNRLWRGRQWIRGRGESNDTQARFGPSRLCHAGNERCGSCVRAENDDARRHIILFTMYSEKHRKLLNSSAIGIDAVLSKPDGMTALSRRSMTRSTPISGPVELEKPYIKPSVSTLPG